jgi:hypothetical protein
MKTSIKGFFPESILAKFSRYTHGDADFLQYHKVPMELGTKRRWRGLY